MDKAVLMSNALNLFKKLENICLALEHEGSSVAPKELKEAQELIDEIRGA